MAEPLASPEQALEQIVQRHRMGRLDDAAELCASALKIWPNDENLRHIQAVITFQRGDVARAIELLRGLASSAPHNAQIRNSLASTLKSAGRRNEAIAAYRDAIALQ